MGLRGFLGLSDINWKEFFGFTKGKVIFLIIAFIIYFFSIFLGIFSIMGLSGSVNLFIIINKIISPFESNGVSLGFLIDLIYYYLLSCIFIYAFKNKNKNLKITGIAIVILINLISLLL
jgi:hypothetical protein